MTKWKHATLLCFASTAAPSVLAQTPPSAPVDPLGAAFRDPPASARPYVWWHWLNGNIDEQGAKLDLQWMKRAGIGGVQLFEGSLATPVLVPERRVFMSPEWKRILRSAVTTASDLGLNFAIASSPGWSATGGPWVTPDAAMKKLVWSEREVIGGRGVAGVLPHPPTVSGPYQDVPVGAIEPGREDELSFYRDVAVVAWRSGGEDVATPSFSSSAGSVSADLLRDGAFGPTLDLPYASAKATAWLQQSFPALTEVRSIVVGVPGPRGFGTPPPPLLRLEASTDGVTFRKVVDLPATRSPVRSVSFSPVVARHFRIVFAAASGAGTGPPPIAPGAVLPKFPSPPPHYSVSEFRVSATSRVHRVEEKAGFAAAANYYALATSTASVARPVAANSVVDLTGRLRPDGTLDWTPPPGRWRIMRFGYSLTGAHNGPAPKEATGLEVDKLSARHVRGYVDDYLARYQEAVGADLIGEGGIAGLLSDSIESGPQNWTEDMVAEFRTRRGYDPLPWLPALTGVVVGSAEASDRFLWDFRRTIGELLARNHYGVLAEAARARGLTYYAEALEDHRPQLGDDMEMRSHADVPMGAMWTIPRGGKANPTYVADLRGAASVAHVYGKPLVAAEALTAFAQPWAFSPRDLKPTADLMFALGVTRPIIHTSAHQPFTDGRLPGLALAVSLGQYFNRNETWAEQARGWTDYLARTSYLLRQGRSHADIAYFYGEEAPITGLYGDTAPTDIPAGYGFDFVGADAVLNRLSVDGGDIVTQNGSRYKVLVLGGSSERMTLATLRKLKALVDAGATVAGRRPLGSPSLADDEDATRQLAETLWGSGKIHGDAAAALKARNLGADWTVGGGAGDLAVLHRQSANRDIYFVSNRRAERTTLDLSLRVTGRAVEIWKADTGSMRPSSYRSIGGRTIVPLILEPHEAVFVVLSGTAAARSRTIAAERLHAALRLDGPWSLRFQPNRGAPAGVRSAPLGSWTASSEPGIRYFSGTGVYSRRLDVPKSWLGDGRSIVLDLGEVHDIAEVTINGRKVGQVWKAPYRLDVASWLKPGRNELTIEVTNLWVNRLIGDAQPGASKVTFTQDESYVAGAPLKPSGLRGPVTVLIDDDASGKRRAPAAAL